MAAFEVIALDTATPQLRAPGASDTYTFPRAVEMPLGTANGVLYLNGSKVMTSGSALTFDGANFQVNGSVTATTGNMVVAAGKGVAFAGDQTQIFTPEDNVSGGLLQWSALGVLRFNAGPSSELMRLTSTGLGIGTSSPAYKLDVAGSARFTNGEFLYFNNASGVAKTVLGYFSDNNTYLDAADGAIIMRTGAGTGERMRLGASGNLGLGVVPSAWGSNYKGFEIVGAGAAIAANGSNAVTIGTGNYINSAGNWIYTTTGTAVGRYELNSGLHRWYTAPSGTAGNAISFTQALTLDASGNLLVGTTSSSFKLNVTTQSGADRDVFIAGISGGSNGFYVQWKHATAKTHVRIADIPISSAGLPSGTLWNDGGTLKIT